VLRIFRHYLSWQVLALVVADLIVLTLATASGRLMPVLGFPPLWMGFSPLIPKTLTFVGLGWFVLYVGGAYDLSPRQSRKEIVVRVMGCFIALTIVLSAVGFALPDLRWGRLALFLALGVGFFGVTIYRLMTLRLWNNPRFRERLVLLGATPLADRLIDLVSHLGGRGYEVLGFVDDRSEAELRMNNGHCVLGRMAELERVATEHRAGTIVITMDERRGRLPVAPMLDCKLRGIRVEDWPSFYERLTGRIGIENLRPSWMIFADGFHRATITRTVKRAMDIALALLFLILGLPLFVAIAAAITLELRGPVFFRQERVGQGGKTFRLLKFRTMVDGAEEETGPVWAAPDDPRITKVGRFLRRSRLDEFPQIVNVLRGEVSFVGPRPERPHFVAMLQRRIPYYGQRLSVRPGITGWAQIRYPYGSTVEEAARKLEYDLYYVKNMSIFLDVLILLSTVQVVLFGRGAR
jgi:sugar transferase (PEP-CTERM system associated)